MYLLSSTYYVRSILLRCRGPTSTGGSSVHVLQPLSFSFSVKRVCRAVRTPIVTRHSSRVTRHSSLVTPPPYWDAGLGPLGGGGERGIGEGLSDEIESLESDQGSSKNLVARADLANDRCRFARACRSADVMKSNY